MAKKITASAKKDYTTVIKSAIKNWADIKELKSWETKSNIKYAEWKKKFTDYTLKVAGKIEAKKKGYFESLSEEKINAFLKECKRRVHQKQYVPIAKPSGGGGRTDDFIIFALQDTSYFDWGNKRYKEMLETYSKGSEADKDEMESDNIIELKRDKTGKVLKTIPRMQWGKKKRAVPVHAWVCNNYGGAMPVSAYEQAIKEGNESEAWEKLMPCVIDLSSNTDKNIHFGDERGDHYVEMKASHIYRGKFAEKRGKKIEEKDGAIWYQFEGKITETDSKDAEDKPIKIKSYSGPRNHTYLLTPAGKKHGIEEIDYKNFDMGENLKAKQVIEYMIDSVIFLQWASCLAYGEEKMHGLANIPTWFEVNFSYRKGRRTALHPIAFEADVSEAFRSKPDEDKEEADQLIFRRFRLDDQLDSKLGDDSDFIDLTLNCNRMTEDLIKKFDGTAQNSRLRVVAMLNQMIEQGEAENITGDCLWFDIVKSTALDDDVITDDLFDIDDDEDTDISLDDKEPEEDFE